MTKSSAASSERFATSFMASRAERAALIQARVAPDSEWNVSTGKKAAMPSPTCEEVHGSGSEATPTRLIGDDTREPRAARSEQRAARSAQRAARSAQQRLPAVAPV